MLELVQHDLRLFSISLAVIVVAFVLVTLAKYVFGRVMLAGVNLDDELFVKDNPAAAVLVLGYGAALVVAATGAVSRAPANLVRELGFLAGAVVVCALLVLLGAWLVLRLKLDLPIRQHISERNVGVAVAAAGAYLAEGLILHGALSSPDAATAGAAPPEWTVEAVLAAAAFFGLSQVPLVLVAFLYRKVVGFDVTAQLARGNAAAGLSYGCVVAATGAILGHAARGEAKQWDRALVEFVLYSVFGLVLLPAMRFGVGVILVPNSSLTHEVGRQDVPNWGAGLLEGFAYLGAAALVCAGS